MGPKPFFLLQMVRKDHTSEMQNLKKSVLSVKVHALNYVSVIHVTENKMSVTF